MKQLNTSKKIHSAFTLIIGLAAFGLLSAVAYGDIITFQDGVGGYTGTADTWIALKSATGNGDETATNYGNGTSLKVERDVSQSDGQGLIRFDNIFGNGAGQIELGSTITSATLSMTTAVGGFADVPSSPSIHQMLVGWTEGTVTWDTFDTSLPADLGSSDLFSINPRGLLAGTDYNSAADDGGGDNLPQGVVGTWDVTASLAAWIAGGTNNGWAFIGTTDNGWDAYTSEFTTIGSRPLLTIDYIPIPEPSTAMLAVLGFSVLCHRNERRK